MKTPAAASDSGAPLRLVRGEGLGVRCRSASALVNWRAAVSARAVRQTQLSASVTNADGLTISAGDVLTLSLCATDEHHEIVRVLEVGCELEAFFPAPNCIAYELLGVRSRQSNYFHFPTKHSFADCCLRRDRADKCYFKRWDGNGVFFNSPKANRLLKLCLEQRNLIHHPAHKANNWTKWSLNFYNWHELNDALTAQIQRLLDTKP